MVVDQPDGRGPGSCVLLVVRARCSWPSAGCVSAGRQRSPRSTRIGRWSVASSTVRMVRHWAPAVPAVNSNSDAASKVPSWCCSPSVGTRDRGRRPCGSHMRLLSGRCSHRARAAWPRAYPLARRGALAAVSGHARRTVGSGPPRTAAGSRWRPGRVCRPGVAKPCHCC